MSGRGTKWYRKNEEKAIEILKGKPTINSGATWKEKGDGQSDKRMIELKSSEKQSIGVKWYDLYKLEKEASDVNKLPFFVIQRLFSQDIEKPLTEEDFYCIIRYDLLIPTLEAYKGEIEAEQIAIENPSVMLEENKEIITTRKKKMVGCGNAKQLKENLIKDQQKKNEKWKEEMKKRK